MTATDYYVIDANGNRLSGPYSARAKATVGLKDAIRDGVEGATLEHSHIFAIPEGPSEECPKCGALGDEVCLTPTGKPSKKRHAARVRR